VVGIVRARQPADDRPAEVPPSVALQRVVAVPHLEDAARDELRLERVGLGRKTVDLLLDRGDERADDGVADGLVGLSARGSPAGRGAVSGAGQAAIGAAAHRATREVGACGTCRGVAMIPF
jgi:hypothetical protein